MLPTRSVSAMSVKAPTELNTRHLYQLDATDNLPPGIISLAVDHKIDHKYSKILCIPLLNIDIQHRTNSKKDSHRQITIHRCNRFSWRTDGTATTNKPAELPCISPKSCFQLEHNFNKHSISLEDAYIPQKAKDDLASLLEGEYNSIISTSPMDVERTNFF